MLFLIVVEIIPSARAKRRMKLMLIIYGVLWFIRFPLPSTIRSLVNISHFPCGLGHKHIWSINVIKQKCKSCKSFGAKAKSGSVIWDIYINFDASEGFTLS